MGGKSTLLRQTCLAALLAHVGAWVPAEALRLSPVDALFVRMGGALATGPALRQKRAGMRISALHCPLRCILASLLIIHASGCPSVNSGRVCITPSLQQYWCLNVAARDNIFGGQSTFLLELSETAALLNSATRRSLVRRCCRRCESCSACHQTPLLEPCCLLQTSSNTALLTAMGF